MTIHRPASLPEALELLATSPTPLTPIAGATDLFVSWNQRDHADAAFLDLTRLAELRYLRLDDDALRIGALATYWDVICSPEVASAFPLLPQAARLVGAIQTQTRGTWAGNLANGSPAADGVPVMMAYDAVVTLASSRGIEEIPIDRYATGYRSSVRRPDQLIVEIRLPRRTRTREFFHKVGARSAQAIAKVGIAAVQDERGWRIAVSSVAPTVRRCPALEAALNAGRRIADAGELSSLLAQDVSPIDDIRSTARYRMHVLARLLADELLRA